MLFRSGFLYYLAAIALWSGFGLLSHLTAIKPEIAATTDAASIAILPEAIR